MPRHNCGCGPLRYDPRLHWQCRLLGRGRSPGLLEGPELIEEDLQDHGDRHGQERAEDAEHFRTEVEGQDDHQRVEADDLADADIIPYDYVEYARAMRGLTATAARNIAEKHWTNVSLSALDSSITVMETAASKFNETRDAALAKGVSAASRKQANELLMQVERVFVRAGGLPVSKREWFRNVIYAADNDNGYANIGLPSINEAVKAGDEALSVREIADLSQRFIKAAGLLDSAARSLRTQ